MYISRKAKLSMASCSEYTGWKNLPQNSNGAETSNLNFFLSKGVAVVAKKSRPPPPPTTAAVSSLSSASSEHGSANKKENPGVPGPSPGTAAVPAAPSASAGVPPQPPPPPTSKSSGENNEPASPAPSTHPPARSRKQVSSAVFILKRNSVVFFLSFWTLTQINFFV